MMSLEDSVELVLFAFHNANWVIFRSKISGNN